MKFTLSTDVPCDRVTGVAIAVGAADDFDSRPAATTTHTCTAGDLGSLVTVPLHDKTSSMGIKIVLGAGRDPTDCATTFGTGCIVARRALSYVPHTRLTLEVPLNSACLGVACRPNETCVAGACTNAKVTDPGACSGGCGEGALAQPTSNPNVPSARVCGDMGGLEPGAAWPMQGFCPTRLGRSPRVGAQTNGVRWKISVGSPIHSGISIAADGTIYFGASDGKLYAASPTGQLAWSSRAGGAFGQTAGVLGQDATIYAGNDDGNLYAFDSGGGVKWTYKISGNVWPSPVITGDGKILVGGGTGQKSAFAIDRDGKLLWTFTTKGDVLSSPAIATDGTIYVASEDQYLYALGQDGAVKWSFFANDGLQSAVAGENGWIYFNGKPAVCAVDANGSLKWVTKTSGSATTPAIASDGTVYAGSGSGLFYALDGTTGAEKWHAKLTSVDPYLQPIVGADGVIYVGATDGTFYALAPNGSVKWQLPTGSAIHGSAAMGADGTIFFGTEDGTLYAVGP